MPIKSSRISDIAPHSGRFRVRLEYTFTDDRVITIGPFFVKSKADADQALIDRVDNVLESAQGRDAESAVSQGADINQSGEASIKQVARQYLIRAMENTDPYAAYLKLHKAQNYFAGKGWSNAQVRSNLDLTENQWSSIVTRYQYLSSNLTVLQNYKSVLADDPGVGDL